jgi:hypothetical protein
LILQRFISGHLRLFLNQLLVDVLSNCIT